MEIMVKVAVTISRMAITTTIIFTLHYKKLVIEVKK